MKFGRFYIELVVAACLTAAFPARADFLPKIDPFQAEKRVAGYGAKLRPVSCPPRPTLEKPLTLGEVVIASLCHNPDTRAAYLGLLSSADTFAGSYSAYLPDVSATISRSRSATFDDSGKSSLISSSSSLSASMVLYDFGQREISIERGEMALRAAGFSYDSTMQGMIAQALRGYYALLTAQNALAVARETERFSQESNEAARVRHEIGLAPLADNLQAKASYSGAVLSTQRAENSLKQQQAALASLMGFSPDAPVAVVEVDDSNLMDPPFEEEVRTLMEQAKLQRNDLRASRIGLESARAGLTALERSQLATVSAGVNMGLDDVDVFNASTGRTQSIGVSVSIPIFTGFSHTYTKRATIKNIEAQEERLTRSELGVEQDVWNAWQNYQTARQSWEVSWDQMATATQLRDVALGRYKEGLGTILDVLSAQAQYSSALQSQLTTRFALLTARVDLVRAVGVLNLDSVAARADSVRGPETLENQPPLTD